MELRFRAARSFGVLLASGALASLSVSACTAFTARDAPVITSAEAGAPAPDIDVDAAIAIEAGAQADAADATSIETNPYGAAYPTNNLGLRVRSGSTPGSVLPNLKFQGYAPGASSLSTVSMADVYDPEGRTHDVAVILEVAQWESLSKTFMAEMNAAPPARVALFVVLIEGPSIGSAATPVDLATWHSQHNVASAWFGHDPRAKNLPALDSAGLPGIIVLDARTMEIVSSEAGKPVDAKSALQARAAEVRRRDPSY